MAKAAKGLTIGGIGQRVRSTLACPILRVVPSERLPLQPSNSIVHANFITTTLAPMGEHRFRESERSAAAAPRWKGRNETKGVWMDPPSRAKVAKDGYFALRRMFKSYRRVIKWRAHLRLFLTGDRRAAWRGLLREPSYTENGGHQVTLCVVIAVGSRDRLKLTRVSRIYRSD